MRLPLFILFLVFSGGYAFAQTLYTFNGGGTSGNWEDASSWTTDPTGSTSVSPRTPRNGDNVVVTNSYVLLLNSNVSATGLTITIQKGGMLDLPTATSGFANTLTRLAGQGTLRISRPYFPTVTNNDFDDANTGTVEFYDWSASPSVLPNPASGQYNNLRLLNTTTTAYTAQLDNDLTLTGNLALTSTNSAAMTLNMGKTASTNRTLTIQGNVMVGTGTTLGVSTVTGSHTLNVSGSFTNNGTVNLHNGTTNDNQVALLNFTGATDASFACNGPTDLGVLQVNKGIDSQVTLNITATFDPTSTNSNLRLRSVTDGIDRLNLINGVARLGSNIQLPQIHNGNTAGTGFTIGATVTAANGSTYVTSPTLWIDGATLINNNANGTAIYGTFRISNGRYENLTNDAMVLREDGQILIEGGETYVDRMRPSNTSTTHRGAFTITGGTFYCKGSTTSPRNTNYARFSIPLLTESFRMSGGTIQVENPTNAVGMFHIGVNPNNAIISGGNIIVVLPATNTNAAILSTAPLWNLTIVKAGTNGSSKAQLTDINVADFAAGTYTSAAQPLTVLNNFTIGLSSLNGTNYYPVTFDATGAQQTPRTQNVTIQGTLTIGSGSSYLPGSNTTIFSGGQNQLLTNNGAIGTANNTFNNLVMDKPAGTLTLGGSANTYTVAGTLSLLNGVLSDGGKTLRVLNNMINSATHTSDGGNGSITLAGSSNQIVSGNDKGIFGNLTISSTAAAGAVAATFTANMAVASTLTMGSNNILNIGANRLSLTNVLSDGTANSALALGPDVSSFSSTCFIQTAGNQSDLGLQKTYGKGDSFLFPVGTITTNGNTTTVRYAPATIKLQLASSAPLDKFGQVSVSPVAARSPFVTTSNNSLAYYWKVRSTGFGAIPSGSVYETFRMTNADAAVTNTSLNNYVPGRYLPTTWTKYTGTVNVGSTSSNINFNALDDFSGEFTAGDPTAFGDVTAYYSTGNGFWRNASTWKTVTGTNAPQAATTAPSSNNPVFIGSAADKVYHTVTVDANNAQSGSLVIDRGSVLDVKATTGHNFGALPDAKVGGSGRLRVSATGTTSATVTFPGGDFGSFIQENGGTVEYYTTGTQNFTVPTASGSLTLNQYRNLWLNAGSGCTITLPSQDLRVYTQLRAGVANSGNTYPGTVLLSTTTNGNLRADSLLAIEAGTLSYNNGTARTLTADTDVRVEAGATFNVTTSNTAVTNALTIGRSLINNGTLDLFNTTTTGTGNSATTTVRKADLVFTSAQNGSFTGTNASGVNGNLTGAFTDLATLTLNKGLGQASTLTLDVAGTLTTPTRNWLTLTNGTLRYARTTGTLTIHDDNAPYLIPETAGLTIDGANANATVATSTTAPATNTSSPSDLRLGGLLQVLQGTLSVGTSGNYGNDLEYASAGAPTIRIGTGGTLYVNGQLRRTTANTDGSLRYDQTGGTVTIDGARATVYQNNERGLFEVQGRGSIFRMSGGTLALRGSNTRPTIIADLYVRPDSTVVTGGTMLLGNNSGSALTVSVESLVPLWDLKVLNGPSSAGTNTGLLTGVNPLSLKGSLTIDGSNAIFNANGLGLSIDQNLINNNTSNTTNLNSGGFWPGTSGQTTTFTGKGQVVQELMGAAGNLTVFGSLTTSNAQTGGTLQLDRNARVAGTLTIAKGTLADNGQTLTTLGDIINSATHTSSGSGSITLAGSTNQNIDGNGKGRFGNVVLSNAAGATTLANQEITNVLTLSNGVLTIGSNLLWLSNPAAGAIAGSSATNFIRTNGIVADLGLRKSYPSSVSDFTFPIGVASKYTPVRMNVTSNGAAGTLTVKPVDLAHPSTTDNANKTEISFYWKVTSTGFSQPTVDHAFTYASDDVNGTEASYQLGRFVNGTWVPKGGLAPSSLNSSTHTISKTGLTYFDGDYTAGYTTEFGDVPTFYSRNATAAKAGGVAWNDATSWTYNADGSDSSPLPTAFPTLANPVVIRSGHLINSNGASRGAASLQLLGTLDLSTYGANNFSTVTGTGTVKIGSALFPAGNYSAFMDASGGTVEFTGAVQLPARDTYNNLTFSGNNGKQLSNLDLTINGALTVMNGTTVDNPTSQNITLTSATSGATLNGTFNLNDGNLTTGAFLTNGGIMTLGAGLTSVGTNLTNSGTLSNGNGDVLVGAAFNNSGTYDASPGTGNLTVGTTFTNSNSYQAGVGKLTTGSDFSNTADGTFTAAGGNVLVNGNFTNAGTYQAAPNILRIAGNFSNSGSFKADASTTSLYGNFSNTGNFNIAGGKSLMQFITDGDRLFTGSTTFYDVQKVSTANLFLSPNTTLTVADILTMRGGLIVTGTSSNVALTTTTTQPILGASTTSYISGRLSMALPNAAASIRVFPVGSGGRYRPVTITPQGTSTNPVVLVEIFNGAPTGTIDQTLSNISANRYYRIQLQSGTITQPAVQLSFNNDVVDEEIHVPGNMRVAYYKSATNNWSTAGGAGVFSPADPRGYTTSAGSQTTINSTSFFALASTNQVDNPLTGPAPLPVELVQFTAARQDMAVRVAWATASEKNSSHFVVQRSADGRTFADIQRVAAKGSSATRSNYATLDAAPLSGMSYYRLLQVDLDGTSSYSPVVAVRFESVAAAPTLVAYPNPATGQGFQLLTANLGAVGGTVQVFDNVGRLVLTQVAAAGTAEAIIRPVQQLTSGMYLVTWQAPDGRKLATKVVIE